MKLFEQRTTYLEMLQKTLDFTAVSAKQFFAHPSNIAKLGFATLAASAGFYFSKGLFQLIWKRVDIILGTPSLVRKTSRVSLLDFYRQPKHTISLLGRRLMTSLDSGLKNTLVLPDGIMHKLSEISQMTKQIRHYRGPLPHILLYGKPGTGKSLFATHLAINSNMHYAIISGSDIIPLGNNAVSEIHKLIDWANFTRKGVIIFIDEADALFITRNMASENLRNAINALLYHTGTDSKKVMVVSATNYPEILDKAFLDRMSFMIEFPKPEFEERKKLIRLFCNKHLQNFNNFSWKLRNNPIQIEIDQNVENEIAIKTQDFSARELEKFIISCYSRAFLSESRVLSSVDVLSYLEEFSANHNVKTKWESEKLIKSQ